MVGKLLGKLFRVPLSLRQRSLLAAIGFASICLLLVLVLVRNQPQPTATPDLSQVQSAETVEGNDSNVQKEAIDPDQLLAKSNAVRISNQKPPLELNERLNGSASAKCEDMVRKNYWSHADPQGNDPWKFIEAAGYEYEHAGENLASGFATAGGTVDGWLNSADHRENLLNDTYSEVGFGICESSDFIGKGPTVIIVQHLARPAQSIARSITQTAADYSSPNCTKTTIPRKTVRIEVDYLYEGDSWTSEGWDGYTETCSASSTGYQPQPISVSPYDTRVFVGTRARQSSVEAPVDEPAE